MRKIIFLFFISFSWILRSQEANLTYRVMLEGDSIPIFGKQYSSNSFTSSFFYSVAQFPNAITQIDFDNYSSGVRNQHPDIKTYISSDQKSIVTILPKHTISGISNFHNFIENTISTQGLPPSLSISVKHLQVVNQYDALDTNRGFN